MIRFDWADAPPAAGTIVCGQPAATPTDDVRLLREIKGGFSFASVIGNVLAYRSWTCEHPVYYRRLGDTTAISNRLGLLLALAPARLNEAALLDLLGHGYILDEEVAFDGIRRLMPGMALRRSGRSYVVDEPDVAEFFAPITFSSMPDLIDEIVERKTGDFARLGEVCLPLSGGKDSRIIAALADRAGILKRARPVYTIGTEYAPDVLAARDVARVLEIGNHSVRRPPVVPRAANLAGLAADTIRCLEGNLSLFDRAGIPVRSSISLDGHEQNMKNTYFDGAPPDGFEAIHAFFQTVKPVDPLALMTPTGHAVAENRFRATLRAMTAVGVPESKLPEAFMWLARGHSWVGSMAGTTNVAACSVNTLMDIDVMSLAMRLGQAERSSHVLSFMLLAKASAHRPLWDVPFASDVWPATLTTVLSTAGWRGPTPAAVPPYVVHPAFPSGINPFIQNDRLAFARLMRRYTQQVLPEADLPFIDGASVGHRLRTDPAASVRRLVGELGCATIALLTEFGGDVLRRSMRETVADRIREATADVEAVVEASTADHRRVAALHDQAIAALTQKVGRTRWTAPRPRSGVRPRWLRPRSYPREVNEWESEIHAQERVIAELARKIRAAQPAPAAAAPSGGAPVPSAVPKVWYDLDVVNTSDRAIEFRFTVNGVQGRARSVEAGAACTVGVSQIGTVLVTADDIEPVTVEVREGLRVYDVVLTDTRARANDRTDNVTTHNQNNA